MVIFLFMCKVNTIFFFLLCFSLVRYNAPYLVIIRLFLGGACAPPFCAVGRLSAPFNALSACWKGLSIRRREVFKGFGRREPESYQAHSIECQVIISSFGIFICNYIIFFTKCFEVMKKLPIFAVVKPKI